MRFFFSVFLTALMVFTATSLFATDDSDSWHVHIKNNVSNSFRLGVIVPGHWAGGLDDSEVLVYIGKTLEEAGLRYMENWSGDPFKLILGLIMSVVGELIDPLAKEIANATYQTIKISCLNNSAEIHPRQTTKDATDTTSIILEPNSTGSVYIEYAYDLWADLSDRHIATFIVITELNDSRNRISIPVEWKYSTDGRDHLALQEPKFKFNGPTAYFTTSYVGGDDGLYLVTVDTSTHDEEANINISISLNKVTFDGKTIPGFPPKGTQWF